MKSNKAILSPQILWYSVGKRSKKTYEHKLHHDPNVPNPSKLPFYLTKHIQYNTKPSSMFEHGYIFLI